MQFVALYKCVYMNVYFCSFIAIVLVFLLIVIHKCYLLLTIVAVISSEVVIVCRRTIVYCLHTSVVTIWSMRVVNATKLRYKGEHRYMNENSYSSLTAYEAFIFLKFNSALFNCNKRSHTRRTQVHICSHTCVRSY